MPPGGFNMPAGPCVTYAGVLKAISLNRARAYHHADDKDSVDCFARYLYNIALVNALWPAVHMLELSLRNGLYAVGVKQNAGRALTFQPHAIECWLDAGLLHDRQSEKVAEAKRRLASGRQSPGHLIAELSFGFWVSLCHSPYEQGRDTGPLLWPSAMDLFYRAPRAKRTRSAVHKELESVLDLRNRLAHHHPVWDRRPDRRFDEVVTVLEWMNPGLASAVRETSVVKQLYSEGHAAFRAAAVGVTSLTT